MISPSDPPALFISYCFFSTGPLSHHQKPLVPFSYYYGGKQLVQKDTSFLLFVRTVPLTRHDLLPSSRLGPPGLIAQLPSSWFGALLSPHSFLCRQRLVLPPHVFLPLPPDVPLFFCCSKANFLLRGRCGLRLISCLAEGILRD